MTIPEVGEWSRDKHYFLWRYLNAFTTAMRKKKWTSLHYIDLFAGAGIERLRDSGELDWGSPLLACQALHCFSRIHVCEKTAPKFRALQSRLTRFPQPAEPQCLRGDANKVIGDIVAEIPPGALSLAFLDPYGLHLNFATIRTLAARRADLIIFFPDRIDALRNWKIYDKPNSNLDRFLGPNVPWLEALQSTPPDRWAEVLRQLYEGQLRTLGYRYFEMERISANNKPLYLLLFCSHHEAGLQIWSRVQQVKPDDQRTFGFE